MNWDIDFELTLLIRCLVILEMYLECKIYVKHLKRRSNTVAVLVENLSREKNIREGCDGGPERGEELEASRPPDEMVGGPES